MINIFMIIQVCHVPELQVFILFYLFFLTSENDINLNSPSYERIIPIRLQDS